MAKILQIHNAYLREGGEDLVLQNEHRRVSPSAGVGMLEWSGEGPGVLEENVHGDGNCQWDRCFSSAGFPAGGWGQNEPVGRDGGAKQIFAQSEDT